MFQNEANCNCICPCHNRPPDLTFNNLPAVSSFYPYHWDGEASAPSSANTCKPDDNDSSSIVKPANDSKTYKYLTLENQLSVILVSDPETDKAAGAMSILAGSMMDPVTVPGLAHFCEHMVFLGTDKYPEENFLGNYVAKNGGDYNAYTDRDLTNFYFDVAPSALQGALDRFAQIFISPLFSEESAEREVSAINSEHEKNIANDFERGALVDNSLCKKDHPYSKFDCGNTLTLWTRPKEQSINIIEKLKDYYKSHYSANLMNLVVLGKESLEELERIVEKIFSPVKNLNLPIPSWPESPYGKDELMTRIDLVPVMSGDSIRLTFPFPDFTEHVKTGAINYLGFLLCDDGQGSVGALLKQRNWSTSGVFVSYERPGKGFSFFIVEVQLTPSGFQNWDKVIQIFFQYIQMLGKEGPQKWVWDEIKVLRETRFRFAEKEEPMRFVDTVALAMPNFPPRDILLSIFSVISEYRPELITQLLDLLVPTNMRIMTTSKLNESIADRTEEWYGTKYKYSRIDNSLIQMWKSSGLHPALRLPDPNPFLPTSFEMKPRDPKSTGKVPRLIECSDMSEVWFLQDREYKLPFANLFLNILSSKPSQSPRSYNLSALFIRAFSDSISEGFSNVWKAGLSYEVDVSREGFRLTVDGYDSKAGCLFEQVLKSLVLFSSEVGAAQFENIKVDYRRDLENWEEEEPYLQATSYVSDLLRKAKWTNEQLLQELIDDKYERNDLATFIDDLFRNIKLKWFFHGNVTEEEALELYKACSCHFRYSQVLSPVECSSIQQGNREGILPPGTVNIYPRLNETHWNSATLLLLQCGAGGTRESVLVDLVESLISQPAYDTLRTQEQLGYVILTYTRKSRGTISLTILVQGEKEPSYLDGRIEYFLKTVSEEIIDNLDEKTFQESVEALSVKKAEKPKAMMAFASDVFEEIELGTYRFCRDEEEIEEIKRISLKDLQEFFNEWISPSAVKRKKLSIQIASDVKDPENIEQHQRRTGAETLTKSESRPANVRTEDKTSGPAREVPEDRPEDIPSDTSFKSVKSKDAIVVRDVSSTKKIVSHSAGGGSAVSFGTLATPTPSNGSQKHPHTMQDEAVDTSLALEEMGTDMEDSFGPSGGYMDETGTSPSRTESSTTQTRRKKKKKLTPKGRKKLHKKPSPVFQSPTATRCHFYTNIETGGITHYGRYSSSHRLVSHLKRQVKGQHPFKSASGTTATNRTSAATPEPSSKPTQRVDAPKRVLNVVESKWVSEIVEKVLAQAGNPEDNNSSDRRHSIRRDTAGMSMMGQWAENLVGSELKEAKRKEPHLLRNVTEKQVTEIVMKALRETIKKPSKDKVTQYSGQPSGRPSRMPDQFFSEFQRRNKDNPSLHKTLQDEQVQTKAPGKKAERSSQYKGVRPWAPPAKGKATQVLESTPKKDDKGQGAVQPRTLSWTPSPVQLFPGTGTSAGGEPRGNNIPRLNLSSEDVSMIHSPEPSSPPPPGGNQGETSQKETPSFLAKIAVLLTSSSKVDPVKRPASNPAEEEKSFPIIRHLTDLLTSSSREVKVQKSEEVEEINIPKQAGNAARNQESDHQLDTQMSPVYDPVSPDSQPNRGDVGGSGGNTADEAKNPSKRTRDEQVPKRPHLLDDNVLRPRKSPSQQDVKQFKPTSSEGKSPKGSVPHEGGEESSKDTEDPSTANEDSQSEEPSIDSEDPEDPSTANEDSEEPSTASKVPDESSIYSKDPVEPGKNSTTTNVSSSPEENPDSEEPNNSSPLDGSKNSGESSSASEDQEEPSSVTNSISPRALSLPEENTETGTSTSASGSEKPNSSPSGRSAGSSSASGSDDTTSSPDSDQGHPTAGPTSHIKIQIDFESSGETAEPTSDSDNTRALSFSEDSSSSGSTPSIIGERRGQPRSAPRSGDGRKAERDFTPEETGVSGSLSGSSGKRTSISSDDRYKSPLEKDSASSSNRSSDGTNGPSPKTTTSRGNISLPPDTKVSDTSSPDAVDRSLNATLDKELAPDDGSKTAAHPADKASKSGDGSKSSPEDKAPGTGAVETSSNPPAGAPASSAAGTAAGAPQESFYKRIAKLLTASQIREEQAQVNGKPGQTSATPAVPSDHGRAIPNPNSKNPQHPDNLDSQLAPGSFLGQPPTSSAKNATNSLGVQTDLGGRTPRNLLADSPTVNPQAAGRVPEDNLKKPDSVYLKLAKLLSGGITQPPPLSSTAPDTNSTSLPNLVASKGQDDGSSKKPNARSDTPYPSPSSTDPSFKWQKFDIKGTNNAPDFSNSSEPPPDPSSSNASLGRPYPRRRVNIIRDLEAWKNSLEYYPLPTSTTPLLTDPKAPPGESPCSLTSSFNNNCASVSSNPNRECHSSNSCPHYYRPAFARRRTSITSCLYSNNNTCTNTGSPPPPPPPPPPAAQCPVYINCQAEPPSPNPCYNVCPRLCQRYVYHCNPNP